MIILAWLSIVVDTFRLDQSIKNPTTYIHTDKMYHSLQWRWPCFTGFSPKSPSTNHTIITHTASPTAATHSPFKIRRSSNLLCIIWSIATAANPGGSGCSWRRHPPHRRTADMVAKKTQPQHPAYGSHQTFYKLTNSCPRTFLLPLDLSCDANRQDATQLLFSLPNPHQEPRQKLLPLITSSPGNLYHSKKPFPSTSTR